MFWLLFSTAFLQCTISQQYQQEPSQQHGGHEGHGDTQFMNPANVAHEKEHIQEHLDVPIDISKMSEQELQFHYFKLHDQDNNDKLDGCELLKSLMHYYDGRKVEVEASVDEIEGSSFVDKFLRKADFDADGFVTFPEWTYNFRNLEREVVILKNGHKAYI